MTNLIPRPEHPEPQWERSSWRNLNGTWEFDFDFGKSALEKKLYESSEPLAREILVPFCPESRLSGIAYTDFIAAVSYRRKFDISAAELTGRVVLHFGAVDYRALVYVNGKLAGEHRGGYSSFELDITALVSVGENTLYVWVEDDTRSGRQPKGKQASKLYSSGCDYTRTTGIWQTVWLEFKPNSYVKSAKFYPDSENATLTVIGETVGDGKLELASSFEGRDTGSATVSTVGGKFIATISLTEKQLWKVGDGRLYDLTIKFGEDSIKSYFGLRNVALEGMKFTLNREPVFQRLVLDQGFYPDGIYTAPTDADLKKDVELSLAVGFNGARLHQKVFEARFLYHCDKLGYIVWGEHGNWGFNCHDPQATEIFLNEWTEIVDRDFNHPSIIGWCPFNETWSYEEKKARNTLLSTVYSFTKHLDVTRPCIDTSGGFHMVTDIFDVHDYDQNPETFKAHYDDYNVTGELYDVRNINNKREVETYGGEPIFMSEYGGIQWNTDGNAGWGYGQAPKSPEEFIARYKGLTDAMLDNPSMLGFCYTQLYDIEQEINGLYTYDRRPKFDVEIFKAINSRKAAIEE